MTVRRGGNDSNDRMTLETGWGDNMGTMTIEETTFTAFDFETTGLYPYSGDRICEVAAVKFSYNSKKPKTFHSLVDPKRSVSPGAFRVNGITDEMVRGKPLIDDILPEFLNFIDGSILVAYNAGFDLGFLEASLGDNAGVLDNYYIIDALSLARLLFPEIGRYNLCTVANSLMVDSGPSHRALADATMTWKVFREELSALIRKGTDRVEDIVSFRRITPSRKQGMAQDSGIITMVNNAISEGRRLNILYRSSWRSGLSNRVITPKKLRRGYDRSYVTAYCHLRKEERIFRLDCIMKADMV